MGVKVCLTQCVVIISLAHEHLVVAMFIFRVHAMNHKVHVSSLDTIGHGMTWQWILLHSHGIHICTGLMSTFSHGFT